MADIAGTMFGKYMLLRRIESGGMGEIFLAKSTGAAGFEKLVVIKRILAQHIDDPDFLEMFLGEAKLASKLSHSNIVQVYDMGQEDDAYFHAMEYIHGKSLRELIDRGLKQGLSFEPGHVVEAISAVCAGLSYAHNMRDITGQPLNIIHRDVNPHNIMLSYAGDIKIIDFGIAKSEIQDHKTETGTLKGKFVYMSPEQSAAEKLDKRSDIFAIGICLYEMLAGHNPFAKANVVLSLDAIQRLDPPPPSSFNPAYAVFDDICRRALAKRPDERYQDAAELREDLQRLLLSGTIQSPARKLPDLLADLFAEQIEKQKQWLREVDSLQPRDGAGMTPAPARRPPTGPLGPPAGWGSGSQPGIPVPAMQPGSVPGYQPYPEQLYGPPSKLPLLIVVSAILFVGIGASAFIIKSARDRQVVYGVRPASASAVLITPGPSSAAGSAPAPAVAAASIPAPAATPVAAPAPLPAAATVPGASDSLGATAARPSPRAGRQGRGAREDDEAASSATVIEASADEPAKTAKKAVDKPERPRPAPAASPAPPVSGKGLGDVLIQSSPNAQVFLDGRYVGQTPALKIPLKAGRGQLLIGDAQTPFRIKIAFQIGGGGIEYRIDADPWAIVSRNDLSLGKTPLAGVTGDGPIMRFAFKQPKVPEPMQVAIKYSPGAP